MKEKGNRMKTIDRIIFGTIAAALMLLALQPYFVDALGHRDMTNVNIAGVGGKKLSFGDPLPIK